MTTEVIGRILSAMNRDDLTVLIHPSEYRLFAKEIEELCDEYCISLHETDNYYYYNGRVYKYYKIGKIVSPLKDIKFIKSMIINQREVYYINGYILSQRYTITPDIIDEYTIYYVVKSLGIPTSNIEAYVRKLREIKTQIKWVELLDMFPNNIMFLTFIANYGDEETKKKANKIILDKTPSMLELYHFIKEKIDGQNCDCH